MANTMLSFLLLATFQEPQMLPTGKMISPIGTHEEVGSYPINMVKTLDGKYAVISTIGFRQALSVVEVSTGKVKSQFDYKTSKNNPNKDGLYFGLAVHPKTGEIYASRGAQDRVSTYQVDASGNISEVGTKIVATPDPSRKKLPFHFAGLAMNSNGSRLLVVNNQTADSTGDRGSVTLYDTLSGHPIGSVKTAGFPFACVYKTIGEGADAKAYVGSERDGTVEVIDLKGMAVKRQIRTGAAPTNLLLTKNQNKLYVSNNASDTVSEIDTKRDQVIDTISVRPVELRGIPGAGPLGLSLSDDEKTLYVALSDMQSIAVIDVKTKTLKGYIPSGWLPTSIVTSGNDILFASAKGNRAANPNGKPVGEKGTYIQDIIAGTVSHSRVPTNAALKKMTQRVIQNNRLTKGLASNKVSGFKNPGIKHVIYVVKENRTYDNVLGDLKKGNGDSSLCLFPRNVTPNQHALAERFVLMDNFYVCAEVSQDGWQWSTSGMPSAYGSRNTPYNYSGRGRSYDTEGQNNGVPVELLGKTNVAKPAAGYIWEHCQNHNVSFRNYGMFDMFIDPEDKRNTTYPGARDSFPVVKVLVGNTDTNFRHYDLNYADSPIYDQYDFSFKSQLRTYGEHKSTNRFSEWKREFDQFVKQGKMPAFQSIRFGNDHTSGTRANAPTPQSMVADNDYAVGMLVETVSKSPFWKDTIICILEDDAQAGIDHVDAHRSTAYVISPYIQKATVDSRFYNTDSMLRTMQLLLGMPPMSQYDAVATPFQFIGSKALNIEPFDAIKPAREIVCATNSRTSYRAKDSERISTSVEESDVDEDLNDILWKSIKGRNSETPKPRFGLQSKRK